MAEIINNVAKVLMWDIFIVGLFALVVLTVTITWLLSESWRESVDRFKTAAERWTALGLVGRSIAVLLITVGIYYTGVIANAVSDDWIDKPNYQHLFLKRLWVEPGAHVDTDDEIKRKIFERIHGASAMRGDIVDYYYYAKHQLWSQELWREYILYSQTMVNIARVWAFVFVLVLAMSILRFGRESIMSYQHWRQKRPEESDAARKDDPAESDAARQALMSLGVAVVALLAYWLGATVWVDSEEEIDSKVFGVYKTLYVGPPALVSRLGPSQPRFDEVPKFPETEASGVAAFDGRLAIVDDKKGHIIIAGAGDAGDDPRSVLIPGVPDDAKLEGISFDGQRFYVVGAHRRDKERVARSFVLTDESGEWKATESKPVTVPIADALSSGEHERATEWIEGLAVERYGDKLHMFVGVRADDPTKTRIMEFRGDKSAQELRKTHVLELPTPGPRPGVFFHLSGLAVMSKNELLVLTASETAENGFHGNRVFLFDRRTGSVTPASPTFALAQKAEGIDVVTTTSGERRFVIVFDNDRLKTGQPSRLVMVRSLADLAE